MLVYVFCYNDATAKRAEHMARQHPFLRPYRLGPSPYFEAQFFFIQSLPYHEWEEHDFVGFISYKYLEKVQDDNLANLPSLCQSLAHCDVIALHDYDYHLLDQAIKMHGSHFEVCWRECLKPFYTEDQIMDVDVPTFYCNYWVAKPAWAIRYCKFAQSLKKHIDHNIQLKETLFANSHYRGGLKANELMNITHRPHYTFHPFVFERTPCIFFFHAKAVIGRRRQRCVWKSYEPFPGEEVAAMVPSATRTLCVFAIHSTLNYFEHNVLVYLANLSKQFDRIVVMTTQLEVINARDIPPNCVYRTVPNQCHDFGMWFRVLWNLPTEALTTIALVNDSCTIHAPLDELFAVAGVHPEWRCWGVTDSVEVQPHLQTYFVVMRDAVIRHLIDFVHQSKMSVKSMQDKWTVVRDFEIGLSLFLNSRGVQFNAVYAWDRVKHCRTVLSESGINPSYALWPCLLVLGCPLLKKKRLHYRHEAEFLKIWSKI